MEINSSMTTIVPGYYNVSNTTDDDISYECGQKVIAYDLFEFIIYGVLGDLICLFGIFGNTISMIIFLQPQMKSSINYLLIGLAGSDNTLIIIGILIAGLPRIYQYTQQSLLFYYNFIILPKIFIFLNPIICTAQVTTVYLTMAVAIERYIAICYPLKVRSFCTYKRAQVAVVVIVVLAFLYNLPKFWEIEIRDGIHWKYNVTVYCIFPSKLGVSEYYNTLYVHWSQFLVYVPFVYIFPFIVLVILNTAIYLQIRKTNKDVQKLTRHQRNEINLTMMLMCIVAIFLICNILPLASKIYETFIDVPPWWMVKIGRFLIAVNSCINFIIYMIFGSKFKRMFLKLFCLSRQHEFKRNNMESQRSNLSIITSMTNIKFSQS